MKGFLIGGLGSTALILAGLGLVFKSAAALAIAVGMFSAIGVGLMTLRRQNRVFRPRLVVKR